MSISAQTVTAGRRRPSISTNIPATDSDRYWWFNQFAKHVANQPGHLGLGEEDAADLTLLAARYETAYMRTCAPATRTPVAIMEKNGARKAALKAFRSAANRIKANPDIPLNVMVGLGFRVR